VIMAANDGEKKAERPSASPAFRLELAAVSSAVVGLELALARRRALRRRSAAGRGVWEPVFVDEAPAAPVSGRRVSSFRDAWKHGVHSYFHPSDAADCAFAGPPTSNLTALKVLRHRA
jgi:hypothetical protein